MVRLHAPLPRRFALQLPLALLPLYGVPQPSKASGVRDGMPFVRKAQLACCGFKGADGPSLVVDFENRGEFTLGTFDVNSKTRTFPGDYGEWVLQESAKTSTWTQLDLGFN